MYVNYFVAQELLARLPLCSITTQPPSALSSHSGSDINQRFGHMTTTIATALNLSHAARMRHRSERLFQHCSAGPGLRGLDSLFNWVQRQVQLVTIRLAYT